MADSEKLTALKKAYADIILNTAKEAAARIMVSERKAHRYQRELFNAKDEALRMLLTLKRMLDTKVSEAQMASSSRQRTIEELEAQLGEAEDIVKDLRAELRELQDELEKLTSSQMQPLGDQNSEGKNATLVAALEDNRLSTSGSVISSLPTLQCDPVKNVTQVAALEDNRLSTSGSVIFSLPTLRCDAVITHKTKNLTLTGTCDDSKCHSANDCNKHNCFVCDHDFASMMMRSKEPELYRNVCTQRIRAFGQNVFGGNLPLSGQADGKNLVFIREDEEDKGICKQLSSKVDDLCGTEKIPDLVKDIEAGNRFRKRRRKRNLSVPSRAEGVMNQLFIKENDKHMCGNLTSDTGCDIKKIFDLAVENGSIPRRLRRKRAARHRRHKEYLSFPCQTVNNAQTGEDSRAVDNISQKDSEHSLSDKNEMITKSGSVEVTKSKTNFDQICEFQNATDNNKLSIDEMKLTRQVVGSTESSEFPASKTDFEMVNTLLATSNQKEPDAIEVVPTRPMNNKFLKYTFQRKRKKEPPSSPDGDSSLYCSTLKRKMGEKQSGFLESQKSGLIAESSRDNRRMAQVVHQFVSLSEKKWW